MASSSVSPRPIISCISTKKSNSQEAIIGKLRRAEIMLSQGATVAEVYRKIEVTDDVTFYR